MTWHYHTHSTYFTSGGYKYIRQIVTIRINVFDVDHDLLATVPHSSTQVHLYTWLCIVLHIMQYSYNKRNLRLHYTCLTICGSKGATPWGSGFWHTYLSKSRCIRSCPPYEALWKIGPLTAYFYRYFTRVRKDLVWNGLKLAHMLQV